MGLVGVLPGDHRYNTPLSERDLIPRGLPATARTKGSFKAKAILDLDKSLESSGVMSPTSRLRRRRVEPSEASGCQVSARGSVKTFPSSPLHRPQIP